MRKIRDVLRLRAAGISKRQVAAFLSVSRTTVLNCLRRAEVVGLGWPSPADLTDEALAARLYPPPRTPCRLSSAGGGASLRGFRQLSRQGGRLRFFPA